MFLMNKLSLQLLDKSKEAFMMAIEIYNKPTIRYRVEGFSIFICNAWELMLKAHMINIFGESSIYYTDNKNRTLTLENCIKKVFTNDKDPLRINLEKIIELRNISTHFITEEYEMVYVPLFQSCVLNYNEKMFTFHSIDVTELIPQNFLTLVISMKSLIEEEIIAKYPEEISSKLLSTSTNINDLIISSNNSAFAIKIEHHHYITKNKDKATAIVKIDNNADTPVKIIKDVRNPNETHNFTTKKCIEAINNMILKNNIPFLYNGEHKKFTSNDFTLFCKYFNIKQDPKQCYTYTLNAAPTYSYSIHAVNFIYEEIKKDPENIIQNLKERLVLK